MKYLLFLIVLLMTCSFAAAEEMGLRSIRFEEYTRAGQEIPIFVSIKNVASHNLEDLQVRVVSLDMNIFATSDSVDLREKDTSSFVIPVYISANVQPGEYTLWFSVTDDDDIDRSFFRIITIY